MSHLISDTATGPAVVTSTEERGTERLRRWLASGPGAARPPRAGLMAGSAA